MLATLAAAILILSLAACGAPTIEVDLDTHFQTFDAWSAMVEVGDSDKPQAEVARYREEMLEWIVDSIGITRLRQPLRSGQESRTDLTESYLRDNSQRVPWRRTWFAIENDNDDPFVADESGFWFSYLDHEIETIVLPIKRRVEARGEPFYLNLNYVDFGSSAFEHRDDPQEFAEFVLVMVQHLDSKYGLIADAIEILEPDNEGDWSARDVAEGFVAAGDRLTAAGYDLDFIGPSNITVSGALSYLEEMFTVPGLDRYLKEISYHKYGAYELDQLRQIASVARAHGLRTSMLEYLNATTKDVYEDLTLAEVSAWQKFSILDYVSPTSDGRVAFTDDVAQLRLYTMNIRPGAVRLGAVSTRRSHQPVAFVNADGSIVVVVRAGRSGRFAVTGLPAGTYQAVVVYDEDYERDDVALTDEGGILSGTLRRPGVLLLRTAVGS